MAVTEFMGRGEERRRMDGEVFGKGVGRGKNGKNGKVRRKVVERLGEGKEALGRAGRWYGWEECLVEVGDRVVVVGKGGVEGRDRGMIGKVIEVRKVEGEVVVEGLNLVSWRDFSFGCVGVSLGKGAGGFSWLYGNLSFRFAVMLDTSFYCWHIY